MAVLIYVTRLASNEQYFECDEAAALVTAEQNYLLPLSSVSCKNSPIWKPFHCKVK